MRFVGWKEKELRDYRAPMVLVLLGFIKSYQNHIAELILSQILGGVRLVR